MKLAKISGCSSAVTRTTHRAIDRIGFSETVLGATADGADASHRKIHTFAPAYFATELRASWWQIYAHLGEWVGILSRFRYRLIEPASCYLPSRTAHAYRVSPASPAGLDDRARRARRYFERQCLCIKLKIAFKILHNACIDSSIYVR